MISDPSQMKISNVQFSMGVDALVKETIAPELGLKDSNVACNLYKVLLYEPGGFFVSIFSVVASCKH